MRRLKKLEVSIEESAVASAEILLGVVSIKLTLRGNVGWPDRIFFIPGGRPFLIEFKRPNEHPTARQAMIHRALRKLGYDIEVHDDAAFALQAIRGRVEAAQLSTQGCKISARTRRRRPIP